MAEERFINIYHNPLTSKLDWRIYLTQPVAADISQPPIHLLGVAVITISCYSCRDHIINILCSTLFLFPNLNQQLGNIFVQFSITYP